MHDVDRLSHIYQTVSQRILDVELRTGYEANAFSSSGHFIKDVLAITAVHSMRKEAVQTLLDKTKTNWDSVQYLVQ